MTDTVIRVDGLGKRFQIGERHPGEGLRHVLNRGLTAPFRVGRHHRPHPTTRRSETIWALKEVGFELRRGQILGLIGANGSGKSTLLKILSRITDPTEGEVDIHGRTSSLLEVGTGFQPELTGRENTYLNGAILGMKRTEIDRKFPEIVEFAELKTFIDTPVKYYSSGMYMRLAFAVAAHLEPDILLVDEVLAVGDASFQKKCLGKMDEVARHGRTVILVSHNMDAIGRLCETALHLERGRVRAIGPASEITVGYLADLKSAQAHDLAQHRLPGFGDDIQFTDISLLAQDRPNVPFGRPIDIRLTIHSNRSFEGLSIGAGIFTMAGTCIATLGCTSQEFSMATDQDRTVRLSISHPLVAPGWYYAGFSIGRGGFSRKRTDYDIVIGMPVFQVLPDTRVADWHPNWGRIVIEDAQMVVEDPS